MALKSFNDGSGKADCSATSLACAAMLEQFWYEFDNDWEKLLARHNLKCFHMTDAVALKNHFSKGNGWNKEKVRSLISEIVLILNRHQQRSMQFRCSTVLRNDYKRAKASHPTLRPIPAICANYTVGGLRVPKGEDVILYFDRNEEFLHQVNRVWLKLKPEQVLSLPCNLFLICLCARSCSVLKVHPQSPHLQCGTGFLAASD